jgi:hypothetical protein
MGTVDSTELTRTYQAMKFESSNIGWAWFALALGLVAGCDTTEAPSNKPQNPAQQTGQSTQTKFKPGVVDPYVKSPDCALKVFFTSPGTGIDVTRYKQIKELLEQDDAVNNVQPYSRGREGETELCVQLADDGQINRLFNELKAVLPSDSNGRSIFIVTKSGIRFGN